MKSPRNKTLTINPNKTIKKDKNVFCGDFFDEIDRIKNKSIDLLIADPPYNLSKKFNSSCFKKMDTASYEKYTEKWIGKIKPKLKPSASLYVFGDWRSSGCLFNVLSEHFIVRNRITFEREKGRGAKTNFKNCSEDIFFATCSDTYTFSVDAIKLRKKVIAPYKENGKPKDWQESNGCKYRDTYPSNLWTDITIPFWSMPENTIHPTQKPEKLIAKLILVSSQENDTILDPFLGSGTTAVVAKKLNRKYKGSEIDDYYYKLAIERLLIANTEKRIQGYKDGIFWERNGL
jgi:site-specific DNA-methyltransferase (adenine-specific)